jgi:regulator of sirC expression with transglutaminase-like and TPR domain
LHVSGAVIVSEPGATMARFRELIHLPDEDIDLAEAALLIAKNAEQDLDVARYLARIDELAQQLSARLPQGSRDTEFVLALNRFLFEEHGFGPNLEDYYDLRNSFLNQVLERRLGIPISLSILYIEVGRRIGLRLQGVSFPGHFLVKCELSGGSVILDPYRSGISLGLHDLQQLLREARGGEVSRAIVASMLVSASKKEILERMLRNLKAIYLERRDHVHALSVMEWIVAVAPADASQVRDRGLLYLELECFRAALEDLQCYLTLAPGASDVGDIGRRVVELRQAAARLN